VISVPTSSGSAPNCPALGSQLLSKTKSNTPAAHEEVDDQNEDQRGERGEPVLQCAVRQARKRRPLEQ
jgi:hypothetical protein